MVRHRRFEPIEFGFRVPIQLLYLDLRELEHVFDGSRLWSVDAHAPVQFRRRDHLGPEDEALEHSVARLVEARLGRKPRGPIRLLTSPRYLGLVFNPISLYYCFDERGEELDALVAEVTNTPWGERHCYVLDLAAEGEAGSERPTRASRQTAKIFHVSPFMEMAMSYDWRIATPGQTLTFSIRNELSDRPPAANRAFGVPFFQADLALNRREIDPSSLRASFWRAPFQSGRILLGIYRQAFRLAWRRVPFVKHPARRWPRDFADAELLGAPMESHP
jgi:DUF1365 family protein